MNLHLIQHSLSSLLDLGARPECVSIRGFQPRCVAHVGTVDLEHVLADDKGRATDLNLTGQGTGHTRCSLLELVTGSHDGQPGSPNGPVCTVIGFSGELASVVIVRHADTVVHFLAGLVDNHEVLVRTNGVSGDREHVTGTGHAFQQFTSTSGHPEELGVGGDHLFLSVFIKEPTDRLITVLVDDSVLQ